MVYEVLFYIRKMTGDHDAVETNVEQKATPCPDVACKRCAALFFPIWTCVAKSAVEGRCGESGSYRALDSC